MASDKVVIDIVPESSGKGQSAAESTTVQASSQPSDSSSSWMPSWLSGAAGLRGRPQVPSGNADVEKGLQKGEAVKRTHSSGAADKTERLPPVLLPSRHPSRHMSVSEKEQSSMVAEKSSNIKQEEAKRKAKAAAPQIPRAGTMKSNFSYDTLKERADVWRRERSKRPTKAPPLERQDSFIERPTDRSRKSIHEFGHVEEGNRPKIRFTPEESDKVDKDILRLMGALEHSRYPFNRDKHHLFSKLRFIRRKQLGLLFAHRELDSTGYFDTDRDELGYDVISSKIGTMHSVIDAISRDVYELRELLYYEKKNQTPPNRRGSSDRRTSSEPPPVEQVKPTSRRPRMASYDPVQSRAAHKPSINPLPTIPSASRLEQHNHSAPSPNRSLLKHSLSTESFKSAKSDDTLTED
ncbi:hypothetical protein RvY_09799 [Ramazzottius varieornatus]|uniref:Uncharacterized protein n=1 Tax=Ramazzottius varieornatus TaxID=947166 RepID=A0A1D1VCZ4_RAMVA|nr:hypothetical protein RvY_09799 [Ramazzottius varieornatus]